MRWAYLAIVPAQIVYIVVLLFLSMVILKFQNTKNNCGAVKLG